MSYNNQYVFLNDNETFSALDGATLVIETDVAGMRVGCYDLRTLLQNISLNAWHDAMIDPSLSIIHALKERSSAYQVDFPAIVESIREDEE